MTTYEEVLASVLPLMTTYAHFWLGMAPNSKTGLGNFIVGSNPTLSANLSKQIKYIPQRAAVGLVDFCVLATGAGHRGEFAALDVKYLGQEPARRPEFAGLVLLVCALGAVEVGGDHNFISWGNHRSSEPPQFSKRHSQPPRQLASVPDRQYNSW